MMFKVQNIHLKSVKILSNKKKKRKNYLIYQKDYLLMKIKKIYLIISQSMSLGNLQQFILYLHQIYLNQFKQNRIIQSIYIIFLIF